MRVVDVPQSGKTGTGTMTEHLAGAKREPLGYRARRLFVEWKIESKRLDPGHHLAHIPGGPLAVDIARLLIWWWQTSAAVKKATGISRLYQFFDIARLTWGERLHGQIYYMFEL